MFNFDDENLKSFSISRIWVEKKNFNVLNFEFFKLKVNGASLITQ